MTTTTKSDRIVFLCTCSGYGLFMLFLIIAFSGKIHSHYISRATAFTLYMPSWNLYNASPVWREDQLYKLESGRFNYVDMRPVTGKYLYGIDRTPKVLAQEVGVITFDTTLMKSLPHYSMHMPLLAGCPPENFLDTGRIVYTKICRPQIRLLRGKYIIAMHMPAGRKDAKTLPMPMDVIAVNIVGQ